MQDVETNTNDNCSNLFEVTVKGQELWICGFRKSIKLDNIKEIKIPNVLYNHCVTKISKFAFEGNNYIEDVILPDTITEIGEKAFSECSNLKVIRLSEKLKVIKQNAFRNCVLLEFCNFPNSLELLENGCFYNCNNLKSTVKLSNIKKIGQFAFFGVNEKFSLTVLNTYCEIDHAIHEYRLNIPYENKKFYEYLYKVNYKHEYQKCYPEYYQSDFCDFYEFLRIFKDMLLFAPFEFDGYFFIEDEVVSKKIKILYKIYKKFVGINIRFETFIEDVLGNFFKDIIKITPDLSADYYIPWLKISLNKDNIKIDSIFYLLFRIINKINLLSYCNRNIINYFETIIPEYNLYKLKKIKVLKKNNVIKTENKIKLPDNIEIISSYAFAGSIFINIDIGNVSIIEDRAFEYCEKLEFFYASKALKKIGSRAFLHCTSLKVLFIPSSVEEIGDYAFQNCYELETIVLPQKFIDKRILFSGCRKLKNIIAAI